MKTDDGGPAFPRPISEDRTHGDLFDGNDMVPAQNGMSLRDWFAGQALAGADMGQELGESVFDPIQLKHFAERMAHDCYVMADAMLVARKKSP